MTTILVGPRALVLAALAALFTFSVPERLGAQAGGREGTLFVSVVDDRDEPVTGLGPDDFIVREDGVRREVLRASPATEPIDIALLVDNSAAAADDIRNIRDGVTAFVRRMHEKHQIALVGLADRPTILVDYTHDLKRLEEGIGRLFAQPGSGMTLLDALIEVSRGLGRREGARAVIVPVLTAGTEFSNRHYQTVIDAVKASDAALYPLTIGTFDVAVSGPARDRASVLAEGPKATGGEHETVLSSMAVEQALERLARQLSAQYKVVYGRPESLIPPQRVTVEVAKPGLTARGTPVRRKAGA